MTEASETFTARMEPAEAAAATSVLMIRQSAFSNLQVAVREFYAAYGAHDAEWMLPFVQTRAKLEVEEALAKLEAQQ